MCWSSCKKRGPGTGLRLLYLDECTLHTHPGLAKGWQRRGQPRPIPAAGQDRRATVFGAVDYGSGEVTTLIARHGNGTQFRHFVQQLVTRYADGQLVLVADNATYHTSTAVRQWLQRLGDRVHLLWLPTYSPHLNLIERLWRVLKSRVACHRFWNDMPSLIHLANAVLHRMHASFSTTPYPHVRVE